MEITAEFRDGRKAIYTRAIWDLLVTDADVIAIMDNQTGEILFNRNMEGPPI